MRPHTDPGAKQRCRHKDPYRICLLGLRTQQQLQNFAASCPRPRAPARVPLLLSMGASRICPEHGGITTIHSLACLEALNFNSNEELGRNRSRFAVKLRLGSCICLLRRPASALLSLRAATGPRPPLPTHDISVFPISMGAASAESPFSLLCNPVPKFSPYPKPLPARGRLWS